MFNRDGEIWPQLAAYLCAVIVAVSVLYGIGRLLTGDNLELFPTSDARGGTFYWMNRTRRKRMSCGSGQTESATGPAVKMALQ